MECYKLRKTLEALDQDKTKTLKDFRYLHSEVSANSTSKLSTLSKLSRASRSRRASDDSDSEDEKEKETKKKLRARKRHSDDPSTIA